MKETFSTNKNRFRGETKMIWNKNLTRDPICGMKQTPNKGIEKDSKWFCSDKCLKEMEYRLKSHQ